MRAKDILASGKGMSKNERDDISTEDRIRGTSDVPLAAKGHQQAEALGKKLAGKVDCIYTSPLKRAKDTAKAILLTNPGAEFIVAKELMPWHLGAIEGQATKKVLPEIRNLVVNQPDKVAPGKGTQSTEPGESFNQFCQRVLGYFKEEFGEHEDGEVDLYVTHYRDIKALEAWLKAGKPSNFAVDKPTMLSFAGDEAPGDLFKLEGNKLLIVPNIDTKDGIYLARHGATAWNG